MVAAMRMVVCLSMWLSVCQVSGTYIPQEMNRTLQNLRQHYTSLQKISNTDLFDGKHVFSREHLKGKMENQMLFMGGVLEAYEKLFGHMLKQLPTPGPQLAISQNKADASGTGTSGSSAAGDVRSSLTKVLQKIKELKTNRYGEQVNLLQGLQKLKHIEMDNIKVQSKALWELPWVYEEASSLADNVMRRRRRRRQTRSKSRLGA
ncbi:interferon gamma [Fundulus diaphanus]